MAFEGKILRYFWTTLVLYESNPGRFAHFPVRPWVVSPTFPFAPSRFAPGSFRPLSRSPLSRFAHFPLRPWVVSPPYKILFLVLLFRPQKWYKALFFLAYWWFFVITYKRRKKLSILFWKVTQQSSYVNHNPDLFSVFASIYRMSFYATEKAYSILFEF